MPSIAGKYQHYKNEDIDDYFTAVGVPFMGRKMMAMSSPVMEINLDGDKMTIKNSSLMRTTEYTFKLGEEYVENMPNTAIKSVTILVNDHEFETKSVIPESDAKCGRHYLFTDDECIIGMGFDCLTMSDLQASRRSPASRGSYFRSEGHKTLTHDKAKPGKRYFKRIN